MQPIQITESKVSKILDTIRPGLCHGKGNNAYPGDLCVQQAINLAVGLPPTDIKPECQDEAVHKFDIGMNDCPWSSNEIRAQHMARLATASLGTADWTLEQRKHFSLQLVMYAINVNVPLALRAAADLNPFQEHKDALEVAAIKCEKATDALAAGAAARAAARAAANAADAATLAAARVTDATDAAARAAARVTDATLAAARVTDATLAAARVTAATARDQVLIATTNYAVEVLSEMQTPGSAYLYLTEQ